MGKFKQKVYTVLKFEVEVQENNIEKNVKGDIDLISNVTIKRKLRNYCIDKLRLY